MEGGGKEELPVEMKDICCINIGNPVQHRTRDSCPVAALIFQNKVAFVGRLSLLVIVVHVKLFFPKNLRRKDKFGNGSVIDKGLRTWFFWLNPTHFSWSTLKLLPELSTT